MGQRQGRRAPGWRAALLATAGGTVAFLLVLAAQIRGDELLFEDPATVNHTVKYLGLGTYLRVLMWAVAGTVCLITWLASTDRWQPRASRVLLATGLLSAVVLVDDLFLFHDHVLPVYLHIEEPVTYGLYGLLGIGWLVLAYPVVREGGEAALLACTLALFAVAVGVDALPVHFSGAGVVEDIGEFVGATAWMVLWSRICVARLRRPTISLDGNGHAARTGPTIEPPGPHIEPAGARVRRGPANSTTSTA